MTKALTILALLFSTLSYGQVTKNNPYKNIEGLTIADSITWKDIAGGFYTSDGFCGYDFQLDSAMKFRKIDFSCVARFTVDSGSWAIKNHNVLVIKSFQHRRYYTVFKFDDFYFFILPAQRAKFVRDLRATKSKLKNAKSFKIEDRTFSPAYLIGYSLTRKYFAKDIREKTGT
jgi:hypothetical protein